MLVKAPVLVSKTDKPTNERDFSKEKSDGISLFGRKIQLGSVAVSGAPANTSDNNVVEGNIEESDGPIGSQLRTTPARRRPASARRRSSNNIQKRNASRR